MFEFGNGLVEALARDGEGGGEFGELGVAVSDGFFPEGGLSLVGLLGGGNLGFSLGGHFRESGIGFLVGGDGRLDAFLELGDVAFQRGGTGFLRIVLIAGGDELLAESGDLAAEIALL